MAQPVMMRQPEAGLNNREAWIHAWVFNNGGTYINAFRCWQTECMRNLRRDLDRSFPSDAVLRSYGVIE